LIWGKEDVMNVVVLVKQVPDTEAKIEVKPGTASIVTDTITYVVNPYDEYAVEEALRIKEKLGEGEVTIVGIGPDRATEALRTCLAMGADKAVHLNDDAFEGSDSYVAALALAKALEGLSYDLVLCGKQAVDDDSAAVGIELAELLGIPHVAVVTKIEISDDKTKAVCHREIEGASEVVETSLPAVITAQKGLNEPRYASLKGIMQAKKKPIDAKDVASLGLSAEQVGAQGSKAKIVGMTPPPPRPEGRIVPGEPAEAAREVVRLLRDEAKVI
jgi:electron transfer flavoprotein beta subunit